MITKSTTVPKPTQEPPRQQGGNAIFSILIQSATACETNIQQARKCGPRDLRLMEKRESETNKKLEKEMASEYTALKLRVCE